MHPLDVRDHLERAVILVDTREQDTPRLRERLRQMGCPWERQKLDFGDYSIKCDALDLSDVVTVERKMSLDEICNCYCRERKRFEREFERAKNADAKIYLLIEDATWADAYKGFYRSLMKPEALTASMTAWLARYNCQLLFCETSISGRLIHDVLFRELKERLEALPDEPDG